MSKKKMVEFSKYYSELSKKCRFKKCVFPIESECSEKVVKAHSIQRSKILAYIADDGMVITFDPRRSFFTGNFEEIGIKSASTFSGFCNYHDTKIFSNIENQDYIGTLEQNFLFAYRACVREYVVKNEVLCIDKDLIQRTKNPIFISKFMADSLDIENLVNYLNKFHNELFKPNESRNFNILTTKYYEFPYESLIAVNSVFNLTYDFSRNVINQPTSSKHLVSTFLNIFPQKDKTHVLISNFSDEFHKFRTFFLHIDTLTKTHLENVFSQIILTHCENFCFSPQKWEKIKSVKKREIVSHFQATMLGPLKSDYLSSAATVNLFKLLKK